jgi:hypothetical protein
MLRNPSSTAWRALQNVSSLPHCAHDTVCVYRKVKSVKMDGCVVFVATFIFPSPSTMPAGLIIANHTLGPLQFFFAQPIFAFSLR